MIKSIENLKVNDTITNTILGDELKEINDCKVLGDELKEINDCKVLGDELQKSNQSNQNNQSNQDTITTFNNSEILKIRKNEIIVINENDINRTRYHFDSKEVKDSIIRARKQGIASIELFPYNVKGKYFHLFDTGRDNVFFFKNSEIYPIRNCQYYSEIADQIQVYGYNIYKPHIKLLSKFNKGNNGLIYLGRYSYPDEKEEMVIIKFSEGKQNYGASVEISMMFNLQHPNIIKLIDYYTDGHNNIVRILERAIYGDLYRYIIHHLITVKTIKTIMKELLSVMKYLKDKGIYHNDVKLDNILITCIDPFIIKLSDFDLAGVTSGRFVGTLDYMSPEVIIKSGGGTSWASEIWSIGVVFYELLHPQHSNPFYNKIDRRIIKNIIDIDYCPLIKHLENTLINNQTNSSITNRYQKILKEHRQEYQLADQLLSKIFIKVKERIDIDGMITHPFFKD